jgi:S1-C subfamily serine protease
MPNLQSTPPPSKLIAGLPSSSDESAPFPPARGASSAAPSSDAALLDAYSQAVIGVVRQVGPAVISVTGADPRSPSMGSGFLIAPDGFALTNSHVAQGRKRLKPRLRKGMPCTPTSWGTTRRPTRP